ncbi:hypothetical protein [Proteiniphilum sp.]|uniref:hypothetical protein n=1 Tax=Proteiniphilum sp. TaxID=1926877 RepID=UPI00331D9E69
MKYLEWNNIISAFFFNPANAGKDVYLYLTKGELIGLGRKYLEDEKDEDIWDDFINSIKRGIPWSTGNVIAKAKFAYSKNNSLYHKRPDGSPLEIDGVPVCYPTYIAYLVFLVLPLIENIKDDNIRANNYYARLNAFLQINQINEEIGTTDFRNNQINNLWEDLSIWANVKNNGDLGLFNVIPFTNINWIYVGKVFSQCVLPPKLLNRLPELFESMGLVPDTIYDDRFLQEKIKNSRTDLIPKVTLDFLKKNDELSNSIIQTIQHQYKEWTGETHQEIEEGTVIRKKRNYIIASLLLQFKVNTNDEEIEFSYRMYSSNDYPEDLKFGEFENLYEINGWSRTIPLDFKEGLELKDNFNKWVAKSPIQDVRLFVSAGVFQLSNDFWIETNTLSKTDRMYLLCRNEKKELIKEWGKTFNNGDFREEDFGGLPENYSLFWLRNPTQGLPEIPRLTLYTEKRIDLIGGLKVNFRTYSNDFLPEVEIVNSNGDEKVYLQYKDTGEMIFLSKKTSLNNRWLLSEGIAINTDFYIKVENENFVGNELAYNLASSDNSAIRIDASKLPRRNFFGSITSDAGQYCLGNNIISPMKSSMRHFYPLSWVFTSTNQDNTNSISSAVFDNHNGNKLCSFLSLKSELAAKDFYQAFEFYYSKEFLEFNSNPDFNLSKLKRSSLGFYDFIGVLDYDYETKTIVLNPPQFVFIPTVKGRKVLLIGARDAAMIETIISKAPEHGLQVEITKQFPSNERMLLPDAITIKSFGSSTDNYGERDIKALADELQIKFSSNYFPQIALYDFSADIYDYENTLQLTDEKDYDWARKIFNIETLSFDGSETPSFDKTFSLIEYKLNEYTYQHKLWKDNGCYQIDKNWGRFVALKHHNKDVILFDRTSNKVAIPIGTPLPKLLSKAIMLLSGLAPDLKGIDGKQYRVYENANGLFMQNLFKSKLCQIPIDRLL